MMTDMSREASQTEMTDYDASNLKSSEFKSTEAIMETASQKDQSREQWTGRFDFILSILGYAVGLGSVWRFPFLCYRNGGGVFLIPYLFCMITIGLPIVLIELSVGQFTSNGPLTSWTMVPIFRGIGMSMNIVNFYLNIYYIMIIAYSLYFMILSLRSKLPWETCNPKWASPNCVDNYDPANFTFNHCDDRMRMLRCDDGKCYNSTTLIGTRASCNTTDKALLQYMGYWNPQFPSQDYWNHVVLQKSDGIDNSGGIVWQLILSLIIAWLIVFLMVLKGIKVSGKLVYFTSLFPYVVLLILGIRGWLLPGASDGIKFYLKPDFAKLADIRVWTDAASQIFYVMSVAFGGLIALSSYNEFNNNIYRDTVFVTFSSCLTGVFAGFVVFSYIGYLSHITGQDIDKIIQAGQGLSFVVYPYVTTLKGAPFWAVLFFFMMIILGLDTMMAGIETTITSVLDIFPRLKRDKLTRYLTITTLVLIHFLVGIVFCLRSGTYWIEFFDNYVSGWAVLLTGACECIVIGWFYGLKNFEKDMSVMIGKKLVYNKFFWVWKICWVVVTPGILIGLIGFGFSDVQPLAIPGYKFPYWTHALGQTMTASIFGGIFFWAIYLVADSYFHEKPLLNLIKPDFAKFKPIKYEHQHLMKIVRDVEDAPKPDLRPETPNMAFDNPTFDEGEIRI